MFRSRICSLDRQSLHGSQGLLRAEQQAPESALGNYPCHLPERICRRSTWERWGLDSPVW